MEKASSKFWHGCFSMDLLFVLQQVVTQFHRHELPSRAWTHHNWTPLLLLFRQSHGLTGRRNRLRNTRINQSAIPYMDLAAITVGMIATWNPSNVKPKGTQCLLSYAVPGSHNKLTICTNPTLEFHIHMIKRFVSALSYCNFTSVK